MISLEDKMLVAQNCEEYEPKDYVNITNMSYMSQNCNYCINYNNGTCDKKLFDKIDKMIKVN
ncbi:hypothetical protein [Clostridium scatologenes]|uniref:Uncharacterized protein n=1 Tax=Clostridium scatologenes TaxID=1548 RepID=A0A0E3K3E3_CLOSL|nr:hypothetical protein [Clostridium scatologenes]AKA71187.1 hypothetical protein CSCA_4062 [Clostridium scatologenes]